MSSFIFLKKKIVGPDYYGPFPKRMDWPTFQGALNYALEQLGSINFLLEIEHQHLWNFGLSVKKTSPTTALLESTGYHTHGMKKGKQVDPELIDALLRMGLTQPSGETRNWTIELSGEDIERDRLVEIVVHILEMGYMFNPNLIQEVNISPN